MPDHFTQRTRRIITLAGDISLRHGLSGITDLAVLIAIVEEGGGIAATLLHGLGVELDPLYQYLPKAQGDLRILDLARPLAPSPECHRVLETAEGVATEYGAEQVGTEHLLVAIVRTVECQAAVLLAEHGVTETAIRQTATHYV